MARAAVNRALAAKIIALTIRQPFGFAKLRGCGLAAEGERMRAAGLIELSAAANDDPNIIVIKSVTEAGLRFLRGVDDERARRRAEYRFSFSLSKTEEEVSLV